MNNSGGMSRNITSVFYAESYHPIQAGSIDGTDIHPHDNAVCRALLCSNSGLYDPFGDPKVIGDPYCTIFVGRLSHFTTEETLRQAMSKYGRVKNLRLVRHIVTGASRGYAFVEFETEREMRRAYMDAHHTSIDDSEIIVDYNRQQLMPGWIPRRLGGGLGGKKESGQLRFGGRERPFRAPLRQIPYDDLKRLSIPAPPGGRYMSRFEVPSPPRRKRLSVDREDYHRHEEESRDSYQLERSPRRRRSSRDKPDRSESRDSYQLERSPRHRRRSRDKPDRSESRDSHQVERSPSDKPGRSESRDSHQLERSPRHRRRSRDKPDRSESGDSHQMQRSSRHRSRSRDKLDHSEGRDSYRLERSPRRQSRSRVEPDRAESRDSYWRERSPSRQKRSGDKPDRSSKRHRSSRHGRRSGSHDRSSEDRSSHEHRRYSGESDRYSPRATRNSTPDQ